MKDLPFPPFQPPQEVPSTTHAQQTNASARDRAAEMRRLYESGLPVPEIAERFGIKPASVYVAFSRHGLTGGSDKKRGWRGDPEGHSRAGKQGGKAVSQDREHMAEMGRKGGQKLSADREHMAQIGRKGGQSASQDRQHMAEIGRAGSESRWSKTKSDGPEKGA